MTEKLVAFVALFILTQIGCFVASFFGLCITFPMSIVYFTMIIILQYIYDLMAIFIGVKATKIISNIIAMIAIIIFFTSSVLTLSSSLVMLALIGLIVVVC